MEELISDNIYLILLLPLWIFLIIMLGRFFSVYVNKAIICGLSLFASLSGAISSLWLYGIFTPDKVYESTFPFIKINDFIISCGLHIDRIALIFVSTLFIISFLVQLFSISYMKNEKKEYRFYALLNLFNFALGSLFFSPNLFQTYVFWEIAGLVSYLLIGFDYLKHEKSLASKKVFLINRIGDTAFLAGIIMCSYIMYEYAPCKNLAELSFFDMNTISTLVSVYSSHFLFLIICGLFIIGVVVKSAQIPFYPWLQDAMEAKLPVSALLHSSTLVALGVYLIIRMTPFLTLSPSMLKLIVLIGLLTAFVCSLSASVQNHPKKALAYSTSAQFGLMFFAIGTLNIKAGLILFVAHALIKSMLFLTLPEENEKWDLTKFIIFVIGGLSLSGIILSGFCSKEIFACSLGLRGMTALAIISLLTAFYISRLTIVIMKTNGLEKKNNTKTEYLSIIGLLLLNILFCICPVKSESCKITMPFLTAVFGILIVFILHLKNLLVQMSHTFPSCYNGFYLDKLYMTTILDVYNKIAEMSAKFDINILSNYKPAQVLARTGVKIASFVETYIMNGMVKCITVCAKKLSTIDLRIQTGNIQRYNLYAFIILTAIIVCLVIADLTIITGGGQ